MEMRGMKRFGLIMAFVVLAAMLQGCAVGHYVKDRALDGLDIVEVGVTFSKTPQFAFYWNSLDFLVFGYSDFDGYFAGWGGRHLGVTRLRNKCSGLIVGLEEVAWGNDPARKRTGGLAGMPGLMSGMAEYGHPLDSPACVHFFPHIGYVGFVWNVRWGQIIDFIVGFSTVDLGDDDSFEHPLYKLNAPRMMTGVTVEKKESVASLPPLHPGMER